MPTLGERLAFCKALADHCEPHTPESLAAYRSQVAAVRQQDEAKRAEPSPQFDLGLSA